MKNQPIHSVLFHLLLTFVYQHNVLATNNELKLSHDIQGLYKQQIAIKNRLKELNHHAYHQKSIYKQLTDTIFKQKDTLSDNTSLIFKKSALIDKLHYQTRILQSYSNHSYHTIQTYFMISKFLFQDS